MILAVSCLSVCFGILGELCNYVGHYLFVCFGVLDGLLSDVDYSLFVRLLYNVFDG